MRDPPIERVTQFTHRDIQTNKVDGLSKDRKRRALDLSISMWNAPFHTQGKNSKIDLHEPQSETNNWVVAHIDVCTTTEHLPIVWGDLKTYGMKYASTWDQKKQEHIDPTTTGYEKHMQQARKTSNQS